MEEINETLHMDLLDFNKTKRQEWVKNRKPFSVLFELTARCNMNCIHCYLQDNHISEQLTTEEIKDIIDILYDKGILFLTLTGGEILTRKDFVEIYLYAKKKGFLVELFSNGYLFTDEIIKVLKKYPPLLVDVSIYGGCEETYKRVTGISGAFEKVIDNCKKLKEANIRVFLKSPMIKETINDLEAMKKIADDIGIKFIYTFEICPTINKDDKTRKHQLPLSVILKHEFENYYYQIKNGERDENENNFTVIQELMNNQCVYSCNVALNSFVIDYKGRMLPCMKLRHRGIKLEKDNYDFIWEKFGEISKIKASEKYACKGCSAKYYCDVCPAEMEFMYSNAEYRDKSICKPAIIRRDFYEKKIKYEDALNLADSY